MADVQDVGRLEPDVFEYASLGMPAMEETTLQWDGEALVLYRGGEESEFHPSTPQWRSLWGALEHSGAWDWEAEYAERGCMDGESWSIRIVQGGRNLRSRGLNAYPPGYADFIRAMDGLVLGRLLGDRL